MAIHQHINIRVFLRTGKEKNSGCIPIYLRVKAGTNEADISLREEIRTYEEWDPIRRCVRPPHPACEKVNEKIIVYREQIESLFSSMTENNDLVNAKDVAEAFKVLRKQQTKLLNKKKNTGRSKIVLPVTLGDKIDRQAVELVQYYNALEKENHNLERDHKEDRKKVLSDKRVVIKSQALLLEKEANIFYDDRSIPKTLGHALDEFLVKLILRTLGEKGSIQTVRRWQVVKNKMIEFFTYRHKMDDILLSDIQFQHAEQFYDYLTLHDGVSNNTAMKHVKNLKQAVERAANKGWVGHNMLRPFKCRYEDADQEGIVMQDVYNILNTDFETPELNRVRDVFVFGCFTGYAYQDLAALSPAHITVGIDGKKWLQLNRGKTSGKEDVPVLRIAEVIIEKYKDDPECITRGRLLPVPSNSQYNILLKSIAQTCGIKRNLTSHIARHTFATTVTLENDVPLPTVQKMLGHRSIKTTEKYAHATRTKISRNMHRLDQDLFNPDGSLIDMKKYYGEVKQMTPKIYGGLTIASKNI